MEKPWSSRRPSSICFGAAVWAHYPWSGGMNQFLRYTAQWEQNTVLKLKDRYEE